MFRAARRPYRRNGDLPTLRLRESFFLLVLAGASVWLRTPELFR